MILNFNGADAQGKLNALSSQLKATEVALNEVRGSAPYHVGAKAMVEEYVRLEKTAHNLIADLEVAAKYKGERRSTMTTAEKAKFIRKNGQEKFLSLPY